MNPLAVIVPVKSAGGKSRLSPVLSETERRKLALSLFRGLMATLARAGLIGDCRVVTSDAQTLSLARSLGAQPVAEGSDSGVNSAVLAGMRAAKGAKEFLVLPSDLPLIEASDVKELLRLRAGGSRVVIAPSSSFDGTNALLFPNDPRFTLSYDRDSFWNHLARASELGVPTGVCARAGIMFDVDSPSDLQELARTRSRQKSAGGAPK